MEWERRQEGEGGWVGRFEGNKKEGVWEGGSGKRKIGWWPKKGRF